MSRNYEHASFKKLLEKLQEESWQLELLISGFAIFGLFSAYEPLKLASREALNDRIIHETVIAQVALFACIILLFNLLLHVLLRGLWIGALGLRYVSGDIDYEELNYGEKFTKYLKKRVGSFDKYIATLENYCSIIFAVSFLLIFYVLALVFTILSIALIADNIIDNDSLPEWLSKGLGIPLIIFILLGMLLTFIDFVTQGWLKKKKWISKIYFPFYWVFSFLTLSFLYRPIVYNFLDNKFGRRLSFILFPLFILLIFSTSLNYKFSNYFNSNNTSSHLVASDNNYEDLLKEGVDFIDDVAIQSKVISDNYVKVFIKYTNNIEDNIFKFNKGLEPENDTRGLSSDIVLGINEASEKKLNLDSLKQEYLNTFNKLFYVKIDSVKFESDFIINKNNLGFETYLPTKSLDIGKHVLKVKYLSLKKQDTIERNLISILFWYYPD